MTEKHIKSSLSYFNRCLKFKITFEDFLFMHVLGNTEILSQHKTAFLCSRRCPASTILKIYDWAIDQRDKGQCVISGFHSRIEKDVLHYLLKGKQPVILALARGMKKRTEPTIRKAVAEGRLLILSPFDDHVIKVTDKTSEIRNRFMISLADEVVVGHVSKGGLLDKVLIKGGSITKPPFFLEDH